MLGKPDISSVIIGIQRQKRDDVVLALGSAGLMHLAEESRGGAGNAAAKAELAVHEQQVRGLLVMAGSVLDVLGERPQHGAGNPVGRDFAEDSRFAAAAKKKLERFEALRAKLRSAIELLNRRLQYAALTASPEAPDRACSGPSLCCLLPGTVPQDFFCPQPDPAMPFVVRRNWQYAIAVALESQRGEVLAVLSRYGFQLDRAVVAPGAVLSCSGGISKRLVSLERRSAALASWLERMKPAWRDRLHSMHAAWSWQLHALEAARAFAFTAEAVFVRGWIDTGDSARVESMLRELCGDRFALIVSANRAEKAPVLLRNNRFFRPFELLVKNIGIPAHNELDPTPLTALSYMLLFGFMFGDIGQGLIIALTGLILQRYAFSCKDHDSLTAQLGGIMAPCGASAALFGLLYGNCFSSERLLPALWFHPMEHISRLFFSAIAMGVVFMVAGFVLNIINRIYRGEMTEALFGKCGMAGLGFYAGSVFLGLRYYGSGTAPALAEIIMFICLPVCLFSCRDLLGLHLLHERRPGGHVLFEQIIEILVEILDLFSGFLANTISFIRAGAFALSHAGLSIATYSLAAMLDPALTGAGAMAVIVLGNIVIIGFEGLICAIQSMRLEYYEFYGKFYRGDGVPFRPFVLQAERL